MNPAYLIRYCVVAPSDGTNEHSPIPHEEVLLVSTDERAHEIFNDRRDEILLVIKQRGWIFVYEPVLFKLVQLS